MEKDLAGPVHRDFFRREKKATGRVVGEVQRRDFRCIELGFGRLEGL